MKKLELSDILKNTNDLSTEKKVGFVAIIGRPNVGKSTFINALLGEKISITTNVPQTTRKKVLGIYNDSQSQIIFFDTPGIHKSEKAFNQQINKEAIDSLKEAELVLYFIDPTRAGGEEEKYIKELLDIANKPLLKVYTKADLPAKIQLPENAMSISSTTQFGFNTLLEKIQETLPQGSLLYPEDYYTKQSMKFRISEVIREKVFLHTKEELPHSTFIGIEEIEDKTEILRIIAYVYVETDSQKYIIIGKGGSLVQQIGKESRVELESIFDKKVFLALRVKVMKHWRKNEKIVKKLFE